MSIAGIDIGTTGCKCTIYSCDGKFLNESYCEYDSLITPKMHSLNPSLVWEKIQEVIKKASKNMEDLESICVTSFGEAAVLLDENDSPVFDALLFSDPNGRDECDEIIQKFGLKSLNNITGLNPDIMYTIVKLMWIKNNKPNLFKKCKQICLFEDYIVYKLSGVFQIDYSLATRTMMFDINNLQWDRDIINFAGIDIKLLPKIVPIGTVAGKIKKEIANRLKINNSILIVSGCHDQIAAAIGTGVLEEGMAVDGTGTVECMINIFDTNVLSIDKSVLYKSSYAQVPFLNNLSVVYAFSFTGGALLKWYREKLAKLDAQICKKEGQNDYEYFDSNVDILKPSGLLILPYFAGAGTPNMDVKAKGAILGLTLDTTKTDIYKGLMEGVTYEMRLNIEKLNEAGINIDSIRATGGGATSEKWLQMKADILKKPILSLGADQSGTLGCIMLAGVACGRYESIEKAAKIFVHVNNTYYPDKKMSEMYDVQYEKYKQIYPKIKDII